MTTTTRNLTGFNDSLESKYTVAEILSSMTATDAITPNTLAAATFITGHTTGTTPTLTPTTLNNIEQTFIQLQNIPNGIPSQEVRRESGFVPPVIEPIGTMPIPVQIKAEMEYYDDSSLGSEQDFGPSSAKRKNVEGANGSYVVPQIDPNTYLVANSRRPTGPRKSKKFNEEIPNEEDGRKAQRRERNKLAAAKCRQRREDHTSRLINETEGLEEKKAQLENEIQCLHQQKDQLEFILQAHTPECQAHNQTLKPSTSTNLPRPTQGKSSVTTTSTNFNSNIRPTSLPITTTVQYKQPVSVVTEALGVTISTPSSGMRVFNFDTMVDGHTGLTPLTEVSTSVPVTIPTTTCAGQLKRKSSEHNGSPNELSTPNNFFRVTL